MSPTSSLTPLFVAPKYSRTDASLLADEIATLALVVTGLRALRVELQRCAGLDALHTPESYRMAAEDFDALIGDLEGLLDTREWREFDSRGEAA